MVMPVGEIGGPDEFEGKGDNPLGDDKSGCGLDPTNCPTIEVDDTVYGTRADGCLENDDAGCNCIQNLSQCDTIGSDGTGGDDGNNGFVDTEHKTGCTLNPADTDCQDSTVCVSGDPRVCSTVVGGGDGDPPADKPPVVYTNDGTTKCGFDPTLCDNIGGDNDGEDNGDDKPPIYTTDGITKCDFDPTLCDDIGGNKPPAGSNKPYVDCAQNPHLSCGKIEPDCTAETVECGFIEKTGCDLDPASCDPISIFDPGFGDDEIQTGSGRGGRSVTHSRFCFGTERTTDW